MVHNLEDEWESFLNGEEYEDEFQTKNSKKSENNEEKTEERETDVIVLQDREINVTIFTFQQDKITYL